MRLSSLIIFAALICLGQGGWLHADATSKPDAAAAATQPSDQTAPTWKEPPAEDVLSSEYRPARPPYPTEGESIDKPIPAQTYGEIEPAPTPPPAPAGSVIHWSDAHQYVGQRITVTGRVVNTYNHRGTVCFLNFHEQWRGRFYIPLFESAFPTDPSKPPEDYYLGQTIEVTGTVTLHKNRPNIEVRDTVQINIVQLQSDQTPPQTAPLDTLE